ncbi:MAG TPA: secondary thiamine-phosphate synthase enzyme YjbQ [Chthoniobacterales bacterium]|nr:secondary thiamine-phosphate synthase enzyme YjbQ [Chthoniobacterales bacterium]
MVKTFSTAFTISTHGIGTYEITDRIDTIVRNSGITTGTATVLLKHTSASLVFFENADPTARADLEEFFRRLVPEDAEYYSHTLEGSDDMPSHIRMALTRTSESIPIMDGSLQLGTWQGLFVYEHRRRPTQRSIAVSVVGDAG